MKYLKIYKYLADWDWENSSVGKMIVTQYSLLD